MERKATSGSPANAPLAAQISAAEALLGG